MKHYFGNYKISALLLWTSLASGCAGMIQDTANTLNPTQQRTGSASSLVDYLFPNGDRPPSPGYQIPNVVVPVRVGLAFVPATRSSDFAPSAAHKAQLLQKMQQAFHGLAVIQDIRILPENSLSPRGGIEDLRRIAGHQGVDLMALVSYDQLGSVSDNPLSLTYWTIIGALIIPGNSHELQTIVETGVYDVRTSKLIIRAAGQDALRDLSSGAMVRTHFHHLSQSSFNRATEKMTIQLRSELDRLRDRLRRNSREVNVWYKPGYQGPTIRDHQYQ